MRVLGISGSPRSGGNTELLIGTALKELATEGIETEFISLADREIRPCDGCASCVGTDPPTCIQDDAGFEGIIDAFRESDGILVGSPVYFGSATPQTMAVLDRVGYVSYRNDRFLRHKVGAAIVVARRAGQNFTFAQINYFFLINEMIVPGSTYWNIAIGKDKGEVASDEEGIRTIKNLASNMAFLLRKLNA